MKSDVLKIRGLIVATCLALGALVSGSYWAGTTPVSGALVIPARVVNVAHNHAVQDATGGAITGLFVAEGDHVRAGQVLLQLDQTAIIDALAQVETQIFEADAALDRLRAQVAGSETVEFRSAPQTLAERDVLQLQRQLFASQREISSERSALFALERDQIAAHLSQLAAQRSALDIQLRVTTEEKAVQDELLDRGLGLAKSQRGLARELARLEAEIGALQAQQEQMQGRLAHIAMQNTHFLSTQHNAVLASVAELQPKRSKLAHKRRELKARLAQRELVAPVDGTIHALSHFRVGEVAKPGETMMQIVRDQQAVKLTGHLAVQHIDSVALGQDVRIRFPTLPQGDIATRHGTITQVSADVIAAPGTGPPFYRIGVTLAPESHANLNRKLLAGVPAEVYLKVKDQTVLSYLLPSIDRFFARAMTEG